MWAYLSIKLSIKAISNFINNYVAIKKYKSYNCKIKQIWNHSGHENYHQNVAWALSRDSSTEIFDSRG